MEALCQPRRVHNAQSEKPTTVRTRQKETARRGLSAAILKIRGKWRQRKKRAMDRVKCTSTWLRLSTKSPKSCKTYLETLAKQFNALCEKELDQVRREYQLLYERENVSADPIKQTPGIVGI